LRAPHNAHPAILVERRLVALKWMLINEQPMINEQTKDKREETSGAGNCGTNIDRKLAGSCLAAVVISDW
jgi:hypothetical protein